MITQHLDAFLGFLVVVAAYIGGFATCAHIHNAALASAVARATTIPSGDIAALKAQVASLTQLVGAKVSGVVSPQQQQPAVAPAAVVVPPAGQAA